MKKIINERNIIIALFMLVFCFMTVGYSMYGQVLNYRGSATLKPDGSMYLLEVKTISTKYANIAEGYPKIEDNRKQIDFGLSFTTNQNAGASDYTAVFEVTIRNDSSYDYVYSLPTYKPTVTRKSTGTPEDSSCVQWSIEGINAGDKIKSKQDTKFTVKYVFTNPHNLNTVETYIIDGKFEPSIIEDNDAHLIGSVDQTKIGDLTGNNEYATFSIKVINSFNSDQAFSIQLDSSKFIATNLDGNENFQYNISANSDKTFEFKVKKVEGAEYSSTIQVIPVLLVPVGEEGTGAGTITTKVDQNVFLDDNTPPTISNVKATIVDEDGKCKVSWEAEDDVLAESFKIIAYNSDGTKVKEETLEHRVTQKTEVSYEMTGLSEGTYYFVVCGTDNSGNTATEEQITNAGSDPGPASKSDNIPLKWYYTIKYILSNNLALGTGTTNNASVLRGSEYTGTIRSTNSDYSLPGKITVKKDNVTVDTSEYSWQEGTITIPNVSGNYEITAAGVKGSGGCFVEGTKILVANGTCKNVEDITYTDLLKVYNHINGQMEDVYPIWIEKEGITSKYEKITFDDGSVLKIAGSHSVFDVDNRKYVDVSNEDEFKIGSNVYKIENNKLKTVKATNIEYIEEKTKYYHVVSTTYYNVIADGFITTDIAAKMSNVYGFKENAIYGDNYYKISQGEKLEYKDVSQYMPYYLYKGINLKNAKSLLNKELDIEYLYQYLTKTTLSPITKDGNRYFIITTCFDEVNENNIDKYLYKEGSIYTVPKNKGKYFIDTSDNTKIYKPGEKIKVQNSIHLK